MPAGTRLDIRDEAAVLPRDRLELRHPLELALERQRHQRRFVDMQHVAGRSELDRLQQDLGHVADPHVLVGVPFRDRLRRFVEPQRAPRVAEPAPGAHRLPDRLGGEVGGRRPPFEPGLVDGEHPRHRGLLEHELADHHAPGPGVLPPPRQITRVGLEPGDDGGVELLVQRTGVGSAGGDEIGGECGRHADDPAMVAVG